MPMRLLPRRLRRYRAARRAEGKDNPRAPAHARHRRAHPRRLVPASTSGCPRCKAAGLEINVRLHDLRHAHASWLLAGGADLQVVQGSASATAASRTTERYLHTLPDADETALDALAKIRSRAAQG